MTERRRHSRWPSVGTRVHVHVPGEETQRCEVRSMSGAGIFIKTRTRLPQGTPVELAFTSLHTRRIVKVYRRSAYVVRSSRDGLVVLFFGKPDT